MAHIYVARESFACELDGAPYNVNVGERVREGHPLLAAYPQSFVPADQNVEHEWETASQETATTPKRGAKK